MVRQCFFYMLLSCGLVTACGSTSTNPVPPGIASRGARLFTLDHCVRCHTVNGVGGIVGPELTHDPVAADPNSLQTLLQNPPTAMTFVKTLHLTDQQIRDISAFTNSSLKPKP